MNDEIHALIGSYNKWCDICNGDRLLKEVMQECPLCQYHRMPDNQCGQCPLYSNGYPCVDEDSTWAQICGIVFVNGYKHSSLDEVADAKLIELCNKQLSHVVEIMRQRGIDYEEKDD